MKKLKFSPLQNREKTQKTAIKTILFIMPIYHKTKMKIMIYTNRITPKQHPKLKYMSHG